MIEFDKEVRKEIAHHIWRIFGFDARKVRIFYANKTIVITVELKESSDVVNVETIIDDWNVISERVRRPSES